MSYIYLVRHGQSEANVKRTWGGNPPLSEKGINDARGVPGQIPGELEKIVASGLLRAQMTAKTAFPGRVIEINTAFNELSLGNLEGLPMVSEDYAIFHNDLPAFLRKIGGGDPVARSEEAISEILNYARQYESTAIFASDMIIRSIIAALRGQTLKEMTHYYIVNGGVITLEYNDGELKVKDDSAVMERVLN